MILVNDNIPNKVSESSPQNIEEKGDEIHKYVYYC